MKRGKRYSEALGKLDKANLYTKEEAVKLVKETSNTKFDATIDVAISLNLDKKLINNYVELLYYLTELVKLKKF